MQHTDDTKKVRVTRTVLSHMEGSQAWADLRHERHDPTWRSSDRAALGWVAKLYDAPCRKDGSCTVALTADEAAHLWEYVDVMAIGAADNVSHDPGALGEINAARGYMRQVRKLWPDLQVWAGLSL